MDIEKIKSEILSKYKSRTSKSVKLHERGKNFLPGGGTRNVAFFSPYPFYATHGSGCYMYDVDGNKYIDCINNMSSLLHGHAFPPIVEALQDQATKGTVHAAPMDMQTDLAEIILNRVKSADTLRFCNSGTEATMFALRGARIASGREIIVKFDGSYHGSHDFVEANMLSDFKSPEDLRPQLSPELGFPPGLNKSILVTPMNNLEHLKQLFSDNKGKIAAMIVEPVVNIGGMPVTPEYIKGVREITEDNGTYLIMDEVITYRHALGGYQQVLDVDCDFTAFGKIIGGGLPVGAFAGKKELMDWYNPLKTPHLMHSGTFSGNAMTMRAGIAALENYTSTEIAKFERLGARLEAGLAKAINTTNFPGQTSRTGSLVYLHLFQGNPQSMYEYFELLLPSMSKVPALNQALLNEGIYVYHKSCLEFILSTVMDEKVIDDIIARVERALAVVQPLMLVKDTTISDQMM
jgi:glutamate-1-semialdehyde 2,1-aminomutase